MQRDQVRRMAKDAFEHLVKQVEAGKSEALTNYLKAMGKFHRYSVGNAILVHLQKPDATHVAGFRAWQRLGRQVRKGEHGIAILAPIVWRKKLPPEQESEEDDEFVRTFKTAYVFDISQTDGEALPEFAKVGGSPEQYTRRLEEYISGKGIKLERSASLRMAEGVSTGGTILLKQSLAPAEEFSVLCHELAHEILHYDVETRPEDKRVRETEAEAVAFTVCHGIGLDVNTASSDYIQLYDGDKKALIESLERIQRAASEILEAIMNEEPQNNVRGTEAGESLAEAA